MAKIKRVTRDNAAWFARYWARRFFAKNGDCPQMWFYLFIAEAVEHGDTQW